MLSCFAVYRLPVVLAIFVIGLYCYRNRVSPWRASAYLWPVGLGILLTSAGDWAMAHGNMINGCIFFGSAHLCWFAFLLRRGKFAWKLAGFMIFLLLPFLAVAVFPAVNNALEIAFSAYAVCSVISVASAYGARKAPAGIWYLSGTGALLISDIFIAVRLAGGSWAGLVVIPVYLASLIFMVIGLIRNIQYAGCKPVMPEPLPELQTKFRNARILLAVGCMLPLLFIAAMLFYNGNYCWYSDYISGSGLVFVRKNGANHLSAWLLSSGLTGSALLCSWYFAERFRWGKGALLLRIMILFFGVLGGVGLAGIGAVPFDQHPDLHNFFTLCTVPYGIAIICSALTPADCFGRRSEKTIWLVFMLFTLAEVCALNYLKNLDGNGLPANPTGPLVQKILVLSFYIYMLGQVISYFYNTNTALKSIPRK